METILVEKLGAVSLRGGLVRVQCLSTGADGEERVSGEMVIPAVAFGQVAGSLQSAGKQLQERIEQARKEQSNEAEQ
jgi:hypothetical protein